MQKPNPQTLAARAAGRDAVLRARGVSVAFDGRPVLQNLDLDVWRGEVLGFVGASGAGKSVLMRTILGLSRRQAGTIEIFGQVYDQLPEDRRLAIDQRIGVLFQHGALFSALTVLENIQVPMREYLDLDPRLMDELARLKLNLVGLPQDAAEKLPSQLSGGMVKRAALARA
ncbi:MAG TPA: ATP-binding cassette domain-containing protein, partial [Rhizobiaceae bacterium]|nr:ATP-binding cassette domain-containing protein [Rhizobiaceae bacterium]